MRRNQHLPTTCQLCRGTANILHCKEDGHASAQDTPLSGHPESRGNRQHHLVPTGDDIGDFRQVLIFCLAHVGIARLRFQG